MKRILSNAMVVCSVVSWGAGCGTSESGDPASGAALRDPDPVTLESLGESVYSSHDGQEPRLDAPTDRLQPTSDLSRGDDPVAKQTHALLVPPGTWDRRVYAAGATVTETLSSWDHHICLMQEFSGPVRCASGSSCSSFRVGVRPDNAIEVDKSGPGLRAVVECFPRSVYSSPGMVPFQRHYDYAFRWDSCSSGEYDFWARGDHAMALTGFGYDFNNISDRVWVKQSDSVTVPNRFGSEAISSPCRITEFFSPLAMRTDGLPVRFYGPGGSGQASAAGQFDVSVSGGQTKTVALAPPDHTCFYTYIAGNMATSSDGAELYGVAPQGAVHLTVHSSASGSVRVKVRCVPRAQ